MNIRTRLEKLEQAIPEEMPIFIVQFVCPVRGNLPIESLRAMNSTEVFTREPYETEEAFVERARAMVTRPAVLVQVIQEGSA